MDFISDDDKPTRSTVDGNDNGKDDAGADSDDDDGGKYDSDDEESNNGKSAFSHLVLPPGHKRMVLSLVSQHFRNKASQKNRDERVDIVKGKGTVGIVSVDRFFQRAQLTKRAGKGLIILLHGAPGVGKTTTAGKTDRQIFCGTIDFIRH
jgi:hypothetical protein